MMYPRHKAWSLFLATLLCLLTTPLLGAQAKAKPSSDDEATRQLETLLIELGRLPEGAWKNRIGALQARISAEESLVAKAEAEVAKVQARAKRHAAIAAKYRAELARLAKIKPLLVKTTMLHPKPKKAKVAVVKAPAKKKVAIAKPAAAKKSRVKKSPVKKAPVKKAVAKKTSTKKAPVKKAPAKKAVAKKTSAKKAPAKKAPAKKAVAKKTSTKKAAPKKSPAKKVVVPKSKAKAAPSKSSAKGGPKAAKPKLENLLTWAKVEPIFEEHCMSCHETGDAEGGLDLTSYATLRAGGGSGKTLVPGNVDGSRLYRLVSHKEKPTMPPDEPRIDKALIETIRTWIAQGAPETEAAAKMLAKKRVQAQVLAKKQADERTKKALARVASAPMPESVPAMDRVMTEQAVGAKTIASSPLAPVVAVPGYGQVLLHHADTNAVLGALPFAFGEIEVLRFTADGKRLLAAGGQVGRKGGAVLYDVKTGAVLRQIEAGFDSVLAADATAEMIALGGSRKRVDVYSVEDGSRLYRVPHDEWVLAIDFDDAGKLLATADRSGKVAVTEASTGRNVHDITGHKTAVNAVAFAPGVGLLATAGEDRSVRLWRMKDGRQLWSKTSHRGPVLSLAWRNPGVLVSGSADGVVRGWKTSGAASGKAKTVGDWVYGLACSSSGKRLFAGDWSGRISVFDLKTSKLVHRFSPTLATQ